MKPEFGDDLTNVIARQSQLIQTRLAGRAVIKVVNQCNEAITDHNLNLSECQLMKVPDAVYHLMRNTPLSMCNLSSNLLTTIPASFANKFQMITELNVSHNKMSKLPDALVNCGNLEKLDVSHNAFTLFPQVIFKLPKIKSTSLANNFIMDMNESEISKTTALQELDMKDNPLSSSSYELLQNSELSFKVILSPPQKHEWDDL